MSFATADSPIVTINHFSGDFTPILTELEELIDLITVLPDSD